MNYVQFFFTNLWLVLQTSITLKLKDAIMRYFDQEEKSNLPNETVCDWS